MGDPTHSLLLRLAAPLQSWGRASQFNRRETSTEPTKSGIVGLLAAAQGRRRHEPIEDLLVLSLGVRIDQPGSLLRDYHTVSDYRGQPLLSASVTAKGTQKPTGPAKFTHVTERFYLQDAVFVAAVGGPADTLGVLSEALRHPVFPLALGRRSCVPTQPLLLAPGPQDADPHHPDLWLGSPLSVLERVPWKASAAHIRRLSRGQGAPATVDLPVTVDDPDGEDSLIDLPSTFDPKDRSFATRRVHHTCVRVRTGAATTEQAPPAHDPFALLGW